MSALKLATCAFLVLASLLRNPRSREGFLFVCSVYAWRIFKDLEGNLGDQDRLTTEDGGKLTYETGSRAEVREVTGDTSEG